MQSEFNIFVDAVAGFEGCPTHDGVHCKVYRDAAGVATIGYGLTQDYYLQQNGKMTKQEAKGILKKKLVDLYGFVSRETKKYGYLFNDYQKMALTDFCYNLGTGNFYKLLDWGKRDAVTISSKILEYNKARVKGKLVELKGLTKRREFEHEYFCKNFNPKVIDVKDFTISMVQVLVNDVFEKKGINKRIEIDGIIGTDTIASLHRILTEYLTELN